MKRTTFTLFEHKWWLPLRRLILMFILAWGSLGFTCMHAQITTNYSTNGDTTTLHSLSTCLGDPSSASTLFTDDNTNDGNYADNQMRKDTIEICPSSAHYHTKVVITEFDLEQGDTLFAYDGNIAALQVNAAPKIGTGAGVGVSKGFGGWINANCDPKINASGCLTFIFQTDGDNAKGKGWEAWVDCAERNITFNNLSIESQTLTKDSSAFAIIVLPAPEIMACGTTVAPTSDSVRLVVTNQLGNICIDTLLSHSGVRNAILDTFAIGIYSAEYTLLSDEKKKKTIPFTVQAPALACNDNITIPLGSACLLTVTPDVILEAHLDTITDTMYYNLTIILGEGENQVVKRTLNFDNHNPVIYPSISIEDIEKAGMSVCDAQATVMIERIYYGLGLPTFCHNGVQRAVCQTNLSFTDQSRPFIIVPTVLDTLITYDTANIHSLLMTSAEAIDNCNKDLPVTISIAMQETDICLSSQGSKDTTKAIITFMAEDDCGNIGTATREMVIIRPNELEHLVKAPDLNLDCTENLMVGSNIPALAIGKLQNGLFVPSDTIPLSTQEYICGYILTIRDLEIPNAECGRKLFRYWSVADWCSPTIVSVDTQFIYYTDKQAPTFLELDTNPVILNLGPFDCTYDITSLPTPEAIDNCSTPHVTRDSVFRIDNGQLTPVPTTMHTALEVDSFYIRWVATDQCSEQKLNDTLMQLVVIQDVTRPTAICTDQLNISVGSNGSMIDVADVDLGSYDACGIAKRGISRDGVNFGSTVTFSCDDVNDTIQVTFRVIDTHGNANSCWFYVLPEDKLRPICTPFAPGVGNANGDNVGNRAYVEIDGNDAKVGAILDRKNPTILELTAIGGTLPIPTDNCTEVENIELTPIVMELGNCGEDRYQRRWIARDASGLESIDTCTQIVSIRHVADWQIKFPRDQALECPMSAIATDSVEITNGPSDRLAVSVESQMFDVVEGACFKVIRTYHIINWCNYTPGDAPSMRLNIDSLSEERILRASDMPNFSYMTYTQIIKVNDNEAPIVVVTDDVDTCITGIHDGLATSIGDSTACGEIKTFTAFAGDCVTEVGGELSHTFRLYEGTESEVVAQQAMEVYNAGDFQKGNEAKMSVFVLPGVYTAEFIFKDNCGNTTLARQSYTFKECTNPTPYVLNGIAIEIGQQSASVDVWANDFDQGSYDNCTPQDSLEFRIWHISLGINPPTTTQGVLDSLPSSITFDCNYLGTQIVRIYVVDQSDNFDYVATFVLIQDNMRACQNPDDDENMVAGEITSFSGEQIENVAVTVNHDESTMTTTTDGHYQFMLAKNRDYTIVPTKNDDVLNGVSTFDLVLISKHILGLNKFDSPYKYIAADVNRSGSITAFDMVQLRQLILNVHTEFPNNQSWRFVDKSYQFATEAPVNEAFNEVISIQDLQENLMQTDFVGVKIGDVNGNATTNSSLVDASERKYMTTFNLQMQDRLVMAGETVRIPITALTVDQIIGYQFTLDFANLELVEVIEGVAKQENFNTSLPTKHQLTTSWNGEINNGATLFELVVKATTTNYLRDLLSITSNYTIAEAYNQAGNLMPVVFDFKPVEEAFEFQLDQNAPNPFQQVTMIGFTLPMNSETTLKIMDVQGRILQTIQGQYAKGYNKIYVDTKNLGATGVLHYQLEAGNYIANKKMIIIE